MSQDAEPSNDAAPREPKVHTATLSEPKADAGKKPRKTKKEKPEPTTPMGKLWHNWVKPIGTVVIIVVVFRSMLLDWNDVPTGSMEPEIHVGDRIAVNRLAYALQFPLTGPTIGIPFTPIQFNNPLDGIPQIQWAKPGRGDIVTFWNPLTDVRMVKRIVAVPGDRIEIRNSVMIINGQAATYEPVDALSQGLDPDTHFEAGNPQTGRRQTISETLTYRKENLLDQVRLTQHIEDRWANQLIYETPTGQLEIISGKRYKQQVTKEAENQPGLYIPEIREITIDQLISSQPDLNVIARLRDGQILIDGEEAGYNELAATLLKRFENGPAAAALESIGLGFEGDDLLVDGEPVFNEVFINAFQARRDNIPVSQRAALASFFNVYSILRESLYSNFGPYTLGEDDYFMVGDNRNNSSDSRYFGPVQLSEITGKAFAVAFSFEDNEMLALPPKPAWKRFFKDLD